MTRTVRAPVVVALLLLAPLAHLVPVAAAEPATDPLTLWFRSTTRVQTADLLFTPDTLAPVPPTSDVPAIAYSMPLLVDDAAYNPFYNAAWEWKSPEGFAFNDTDVKVVFYAVSPGGPLGANGWDVDLWVDDAKMAASDPEVDVDPVEGDVFRYEVTIPSVTLEGEVLGVQIHPFYLFNDWAHAILYDSVDHPSRLEIGNVAPPSDDTTPPVLANLTVEAGATSVRVRWTTDENTTGRVDLGPTTSYGVAATTDFGTAHDVVLGGLVPDETYHLKVTATDPAGNSADSGDLTATTGTTYTLWLHAHENATAYADEFARTDGLPEIGLNVYGGTAGTVESATDTDVVGARTVFPVVPDNPGLLLAPGEAVNGTLNVRAVTRVPIGGTLHEQGAGVLALNLSLFAGDALLGHQTVARELPADGSYVPFRYTFFPDLLEVPRGSLRVEARPEFATTTGYQIGLHGDAASNLTLPFDPVLPLTLAATALDKPMEDLPIRFSAGAFGGAEPYTYAWTVDGVAASTDDEPAFTFPDPGFHAVAVTVTDALGDQASAGLQVRVLQRDFIGESRVVVAVVDTGVNPYHETYRRPGIELPLADLANVTDGRAPRVVNLTFGPDVAANVQADLDTWKGIGTEELVWFNGTNVLGITMGNAGLPILDEHSHGTATSDVVLDAWPDAIVVMVETTASAFSDNLPEAYAWAAKQPWVDVVSASMGMHGNAPDPIWLYQIARSHRVGWESGKIMVNSAGNDPSATPTDGTDGSPFALAVTGSQAGGEGKEVMSSHAYSDFASNYTVLAARHDKVVGDLEISGTSFSCPTVAGTVAGAVHALRRNAGHAGGIVGGELVPTTDVTNRILRDALNRTAEWKTGTGYTVGIHASGDTLVNPVAPWVQVGWGHLDGTYVPAIVQTVESGNVSVPASKAAAAPYMVASWHARNAYWALFDGRGPEAPSLPAPGVPSTRLDGPPLTDDVRAITPIETPHPYPAGADLTWTVHVAGAEGISLHFEQFDVETGFDFVWLETPDGEVHQAYSLEGRHAFWTPFVPGDTVVVRLTTDNYYHRHGFVVEEVGVQ